MKGSVKIVDGVMEIEGYVVRAVILSDNSGVNFYINRKGKVTHPQMRTREVFEKALHAPHVEEEDLFSSPKTTEEEPPAAAEVNEVLEYIKAQPVTRYAVKKHFGFKDKELNAALKDLPVELRKDGAKFHLYVKEA